jgi:hypothetical protein
MRMSLEEKAKKLSEARKPEALVTLKRTGAQISEHGETYTAPGLVMEFGDEGIVFDPIGAMIVGAMGRVDVYPRGSRSRAVMFILAGSVQSPVWEIWRSHDGS